MHSVCAKQQERCCQSEGGLSGVEYRYCFVDGNPTGLILGVDLNIRSLIVGGGDIAFGHIDMLRELVIVDTGYGGATAATERTLEFLGRLIGGSIVSPGQNSKLRFGENQPGAVVRATERAAQIAVAVQSYV